MHENPFHLTQTLSKANKIRASIKNRLLDIMKRVRARKWERLQANDQPTKAQPPQTSYAKLPPELRIKIIEYFIADDPEHWYLLQPGQKIGSSIRNEVYKENRKAWKKTRSRHEQCYRWLLKYHKTHPEFTREFDEVIQGHFTLVFDFSTFRTRSNNHKFNEAYWARAEDCFQDVLKAFRDEYYLRSIRHIRIINIPMLLLSCPRGIRYCCSCHIDLRLTRDRMVDSIVIDQWPQKLSPPEEVLNAHTARIRDPIQYAEDPDTTIDHIRRAQIHMLSCWQSDLLGSWNGKSNGIVSVDALTQSLANLQRFGKAQSKLWIARRMEPEEVEVMTVDQVCTYATEGMCEAAVHKEWAEVQGGFLNVWNCGTYQRTNRGFERTPCRGESARPLELDSLDLLGEESNS